MDLYEYQARNLFRQYGVPVLNGAVATIPEEVRSAARSLLDAGSELVAVKAQIKTDGCGRTGGVKLVRTAEEAEARTRNIPGMDVKGHIVRAVLIPDDVDLGAEYYFSILLDRAERQCLVMYSHEGDMGIKTLAVKYPEALTHIGIDPLRGITPAVSYRIVEAVGFEAGPLVDEVTAVIERLWEVFATEDATLVEINPLVKTADGRIIALDGKVTLDNNSRFRRSARAEFTNNAATDSLEAHACEVGPNYVRLESEVGVPGNGTGLVMPTLDVAAGAGGRHGGMKPTDLLDLGGDSSTKVMTTDLEVVASDPQVRAILVNVFGGITSCNTVTQGIAAVAGPLGGLPKSVVVRLDGNNADTGRIILVDTVTKGVTVVSAMDGTIDVITAIAEKTSDRPTGKEA